MFKGLLFLVLSTFFLGLPSCAKHTAPATISDQNSTVEKLQKNEEVEEELDGEVLDRQEELIGAEVEGAIASQKLSEVPLPDVPVVLNQQVQKWMDYFTGSGRKYFSLWLSRSGRYVPMMKQILKDNGLPEGLIYLSMIESGFKPYALSRAKAVGPWQFMKFTGERYGLRVNYWIDERMDPEKSTIAAAQHLKDLYDEFNHWYLAAAGYNAGAGKISRAITRYRTEDFWEMSKHRYLKPETKNYVPKLLAASIIASEPEKYGFVDIEYQEPVPYEKVVVPEPVALTTVSSSLGIPLEILKDLNPELRKDVTPPNYSNYELKVPVGYQEKFASAYPEMERYKIRDMIVYTVRSGDTLSRIAQRHGVSLSVLTQFNRISTKTILRKGQRLTIPVAMTSVPKSTITAVAVRRNADDYDHYVVQPGDTLWSISRQFNVTVSKLREWNGLGRTKTIHPGQKIIISAKKKSELSRSDVSM